jgi:regulator of PEP synthase PpsR (kinase-PPPase family)
MPTKSKTRKKIVLLSDGTGRTADQLAHAAIAQFGSLDIEIHKENNVRRLSRVQRILAATAQSGSALVYTVVSPRIRECIVTESNRLEIMTVDLLGPALALLTDYLGVAPAGRPGLLYELRKEQFDRMDAVDFTMAHDDGNRLASIDKADVVLVGVSRVSKSVTCFYLASRGVRTANIPLIQGQEPPDELLNLDPAKVFGLVMNAARLASLRASRVNRIKRAIPGYAHVHDIIPELRHARHIIQKNHWNLIDVSHKSTEEVAVQIIEKSLPNAQQIY